MLQRWLYSLDTPFGLAMCSGGVTCQEHFATSDEISFILIKDDRLGMNWDPTANSIEPFAVNNSDWTYDGSNPSFHIWTSDIVIAANENSTLGFTASYDPQETSGNVSYTGTILQFSGGETNGLNNIDVETIFYFSN